MRLAQPLFSYVSIYDQDVVRLAALIADQSPSSRDVQHASILTCLSKLCVPDLVCFERSLRLLQRFLVRRDNFRQRATDGIRFRNAVDLFRTEVPVGYFLIKITHQDRVLRLIKKGSLLPNAFLGKLSLCDLITDRGILKWFSRFVDKRNDGCVDPVDGTVFCAVAQLAVPYVSVCDRRPDVSDEFLRVISGIDYSMVLAEQLLTTVFRYFTKLVINVGYSSRLIGRCHDGGLIDRKFQIGKLLYELTNLTGSISRIDQFIYRFHSIVYSVSDRSYSPAFFNL